MTTTADESADSLTDNAAENVADGGRDKDDPAPVCEALLERMQTLQLATNSASGAPHIGYTPFLLRTGQPQGREFYIFVSQLSAHTRDLLERPQASILIIADEQDSRQIYARVRVSFECDASVIEAGERHSELLDAFAQRHGKMIELLRQLPDFVLFRLVPRDGQFVMGFGKAFKLSGHYLDEFQHARTG